MIELVVTIAVWLFLLAGIVLLHAKVLSIKQYVGVVTAVFGITWIESVLVQPHNWTTQAIGIAFGVTLALSAANLGKWIYRRKTAKARAADQWLHDTIRDREE